jgi:AAHS family 3-hydroxyphenylpropionic acid transporter
MLGPTIAGQLLAAGFGATGVVSAAIPCIVISALLMLILVQRLQKTTA